MVRILIYGMIYLGSALMIWNIARYIRFARHVRQRGDWHSERRVLNVPIALLVLFFLGYLAVGLFGHPDLLVAGILFGGSVFVAVILWIIERISERIQANEQLSARLSAAEEASAAKTFFLSNMSHDIRTPLNAILGFADLAEREGITPEEQSRYLRKIRAAGDQLLAIVNDVLDMSRIESGKLELSPRPTDLERLTHRAGELIAGQMGEKGITFTVSAETGDPWALCDADQLDRVLMNILSNACKFTPAGGSVALTLAQTGRTEDLGTYEFRVKDTGIGMSPEFAAKIFQPFERERTSTVSRTQGTGLGMAICKRIVDMMGGEIRLTTAPGQGTEFVLTFRFPLTAAEEEKRPCPAKGSHCLEGVRLLLAEDNPINAEIACALLEPSGAAVDRVENGMLAVERLSAAPAGTYDLVLMDIQMPVMDGYTAARTIRTLADPEKAAVPILAMTANAFREDETAAEEAGMQGHIAKPLDGQKMLEIIRRTVDRSGASAAG